MIDLPYLLLCESDLDPEPLHASSDLSEDAHTPQLSPQDY